MNAKKISKLNWRNFDLYPMQGSNIVMQCKAYNENKLIDTKYVALNGFNAVTFNPKDVANMIGAESVIFAWLPEEVVNNFLKNNN